MVNKSKPTDWSISWTEPFLDDKDIYYASYEYREDGKSHSVSKYFETYQAAYGWLAENIVL